ncbi:hypothetical protein RFI_12096 [Reticulomyxa filosa]|uniref:Uncharacterized protein n=1 Tax=Reticulomyxa filosa TaxID=46433 RepID=X6NGL7_RETFI|nr:hypothetical protein RFI_12096 [Reticulomyxa filosa]|eukprot:ETO25048.1 hypothetical protein RFI_12096 [Reticulomyxa filosa]
MKQFKDNCHVQRVACHSLSNFAMQMIAANAIIQKVICLSFFCFDKGGFQLLKQAITKFHDDHKLCWLASSAIWNLARPPVNRAVIGTDGVHLMLQVISKHSNEEQVINTAVGALSNLSLLSDLKDVIARPENLDLILNVLSYFTMKKCASVMTSGASLIANIAVSGLLRRKYIFFCTYKKFLKNCTKFFLCYRRARNKFDQKGRAKNFNHAPYMAKK